MEDKYDIILPMDLTAEILSRLLIKSIGRFTLVSKSWRDLITSHGFSSMHAKNKPSSTFYRPPSLNSLFYSGPTFEASENNDITTTIKPARRGPIGFAAEIAGSCNGLLCVIEREIGLETIFISNPITNETRKMATVPNWLVGPDGQERLRGYPSYYRFGYSPSTNEYKVFKSIDVIGSRKEHAVFTVGVDRRWRRLSTDLFFRKHRRHEAAAASIICGGAFHWLITSRDDDDDGGCFDYVLAFDIARETTRTMVVPPHPDHERCLRLLASSDCLCLYEDDMRTKERYGVDWNRPVVLRTGNDCPIDCALARDGRVVRFSSAEFAPTFATIDRVMSNRPI